MHLYFFRSDDFTIYLLIYVGNLILIGSSSVALQTFVDQQSTQFFISDMGFLLYFLSIEVTPYNSSLVPVHCKYFLDVLAKMNMDTFKPVQAALASSSTLLLHDGSLPTNATLYQHTFGSL